jgi:hypothetical protein
MRHLFVVAALFLPLLAQAGTRFGIGAEYTSGDYGSGVDTATWYLPLSITHSGDNYSLGLTVPFIAVSGSSEVSGVRGSGHGTTTTVTTTTTRTDGGIGDVVAKASLQLLAEGESAPWIAITGKVKFGTASASKNLGTGENDYALQLELAKGQFETMIGYNVLGDTDTTDYDNIVYGAVAWVSPIKKNWDLRSEFYMEQPAISGGDPVQELTFSFDTALDKRRNFSLYFIKGLTDASANWGAGVMLSTAL